MDDYIAFEMCYGYRLNQCCFLKYLFILSKRQTPSGKRAISLIDPQLYKQMNEAFNKSKKALDTLLKQKLDQANDRFHPICLGKLQPEDFVTFLLTLSDT